MTRIKCLALPLKLCCLNQILWLVYVRLVENSRFYHFTELPDYDAWAERMVEHGLKVGLRGTP